jgi:hypothetical protein
MITTDRQFDTWRNLARFFARTDFANIDFSPCTDFCATLPVSAAATDMTPPPLCLLIYISFDNI